MINSIIVTNYHGYSEELVLKNPEASGLAITNIEGIGATKASINVTGLATDDGGIFNSAKLGIRNIVLTVQFLWAPDIETVRHKCYELFPVKKEVNLIFVTDYRVCRISGYVESNEPSIFSDKEGAQISIICPDPYFYSALGGGIYTTIFSGVDNLFEFPFSNKSISSNLMEISTSYNLVEQIITYEGDADIGVVMIIKASGNVKNITIINVDTKEQMVIYTDNLTKIVGSAGLIAEDEIYISTIKWSKSITLLRDGKTYNIMSCLSKGTNWIQLSRGDNLLAYMADEGFLNLSFKVENNIIYQGV